MANDCLCDRRKVLDEDNQDHPMISWYHHFNLKMIFRRLVYGFCIGLIIVGSQSWIIAQESRTPIRMKTEQLLDYIRSRNAPALYTGTSNESLRNEKCGFGINAEVHNRWAEFTTAQQAELSKSMKADVMPFNITVGHFRIFYDTTVVDEPALLNAYNQRITGTAAAYIDSVARIFNYVWEVEITQLGYDAPPFETGQSYYNIYIKNLAGYYGETKWSEPPYDGGRRYQSYIEIDNDYQGFKSSGMNGLKVTAAHEFHHAIQIGSYGLWSDDIYAYEITSTWMEDVVYTDVNDYLEYLPNYFNLFSGGLSFTYCIPGDFYYGGYERCIWAHFIAKRFGVDVMRDVWTHMRTEQFLESTEAALLTKGASLQSAFGEFTYWNYYTAFRANTEKYYPEGNFYPLFQPLRIIAFSNTIATANGDVEPLSSSMYTFGRAKDTVVVIIANVDIEAAKRRETTTRSVGVTLSSQSLSQPYQHLANGLNAQISVDDISMWRSYFSQEVLRLNASPNPLRLSEAQQLLLPINEDQANSADVYFYNSSLDLSYSGRWKVWSDYDTRVIIVPVSAVKSKLSSGVYFVVAKTATNTYKWKIAVIR